MGEGARRVSQYEDVVQDSQFSWLSGARRQIPTTDYSIQEKNEIKRKMRIAQKQAELVDEMENAPRVYKLARQKQSESPQRSELNINGQYHYKGNQKDLEAFLNRGGKYRLRGNQSEIQYAASLRNYARIDYTKIAKDAEKLDASLHPKKDWRKTGDYTFEEKSSEGVSSKDGNEELKKQLA